MQEENIIPPPIPPINLKKINKNKFSNSGVIRVVNPIKIAENINIFHKPNLFINLGDIIVPINEAKVQKATKFPTIESEKFSSFK